jgi:anti-anti-sigma regulatory factor|tara:strand:+ start:182 stop:532 length:351 start_codon:yes stop_codon:yes gene_type:complete
MKPTVTILSKLLLGSAINSRESIKLLFNHISNNERYIIDFQKIDFISRAAAHELLIQIEEGQAKGIDISIQNLSSSVNQMIESVSKSRKSNAKKATFVKQVEFDSESDLISYLQAI